MNAKHQTVVNLAAEIESGLPSQQPDQQPEQQPTTAVGSTEHPGETRPPLAAANMTTGLRASDRDSGPVNPADYLDSPTVSPGLSGQRGGSAWRTPNLSSTARSTSAEAVTREGWESTEPQPEALTKAWEHVLSTVADLDAAISDLDKHAAHVRVQHDTEAARVAEQVRTGKAPKQTSGEDADARRRHLAAVVSGHVQRVQDARQAYDDALASEDVRKAWVALLAESLPARAQAVSDAAATVAADLAAVRQAADVQVTLAHGLAHGSEDRAALPKPASADLEGLAAEAAALAEVAAEPTVQAVEPSRWVREQVAYAQSRRALGYEPEYLNLAVIERHEQYRITSHTRGAVPSHILDDAEQNGVHPR